MSKTKKRNLSLLAVLMFVAAAVLLNWSYNQRWGKPDAEMVSAEDAGIREAAARADKMAASTSEYFSEARLTRQKLAMALTKKAYDERCQLTLF